VVILGPLTLLAALFPAVFGGLALVLRNWLVLLFVASLNSTLYFLHAWFRPSLSNSWWGTPVAVWSTMAVITLAGAIWSWQRRRVTGLRTLTSSATQAAAVTPPRSERLILWLGSLTGLVVVCYCLLQGTLLSPPWKELLAIWVVVWAGTLYTLYLRFTANRRPVTKPAPATEGIMLWALVFACAGLGATALPRHTAEGVEVLWTFEAKDRGSIASSPLVAGDRVYVAAAHNWGLTTFGTLYCLDRTTGKELWSFNDDEGLKQVFSSPCLVDGRLYVGEGFHQDAECKLYCLDAATGKKLWDFQTKSHTESSPYVAGGKVFFGAGDDGLYCLDASSGKEQWHFQGLHVDTSPAVAGNRVYAGSGYGSSYEAFCLNTDDGEPVWRIKCDLPVWGSPIVSGEHVFFGLGNGDFVQSADRPAGALLCLVAATGEQVWRYDVADAVLMRPAVDAQRVFFGSRDRHCYCLERKKGELLWKQDLGSPIVAAPALVESTLYAVASGGRVSCLDAANGKTHWTFDVAEHSQTRPQMFSSPVVVVEAAGSNQRRRLYFGAGLYQLFTGAATLYRLEEQ
jgi:outer membrane protein assembly factor BamB